MSAEGRAAPRWRWWFVVCLGLGAFLAAFTALRLTNPNLPPTGPPMRGSDLKSYFLPAMTFLRQALMDGELPLWNPYQLAGTPFIALHSPGALYPFLLIFAPLPPHLALAVHALCHFALAGIFTALYARKIRLQSTAPLAAGLAYMASGPLIAATHNTAYLSTYVWAPAILLAVEGICSRPGRRASAWLATALALSFLSGHAQAFIYSVEMAAIYGFARALTSQPRGKWLRIGAWAVAAGALAGGLVAIQVLPTAAHAAGASRNLGGLNYWMARWSPVKWGELPGLLAGTGGDRIGLPFLFAPLAIAALLSRRRALAAIYLGIFLLSFDFITGTNGLGSKIYYWLPGGNLFRLPMRLAFVYQLAAAVLIGLGTSFVISRTGRGGTRMGQVVAVAIPMVLALDLFWRNPLPYRYDLWSDPWAQKEVESTAELAATAGFDRLFLQNRAWVTVPRRFGLLHNAFVLPDYDPMLPGSYRRFFDLPEEMLWHGRLEVVDPTSRKARERGVARDLFLQPPRRLDLLSVRYYVDARTNADADPHSLQAAVQGRRVRDGPPPVYERAQALPRTYLVKSVVGVDSEEKALARVHELDFDPTQTAVVVGDVTLSAQPLASDERARITSFKRNTVSIEASCNSDCLLVLTDLYDPDWAVRVDGAPRPLLRTNYLVRGVELSAGHHQVEFHYRAPAFWTGASISFAAVLALAWLILSGGRPALRPEAS